MPESCQFSRSLVCPVAQTHEEEKDTPGPHAGLARSHTAPSQPPSAPSRTGHVRHRHTRTLASQKSTNEPETAVTAAPCKSTADFTGLKQLC